MDNIVTWEYYNSLYNKANQAEFPVLEQLAEKQVKLVIGQLKWNGIHESAFYFDQLKDCICKLIDKLVELNTSGAGRGLASVSNDGYTENYIVKTSIEANAEIRECIIYWLRGTGLVSAYPLGG